MTPIGVSKFGRYQFQVTGLLAVQPQAIAQSKSDILSVEQLRTYYSEVWIKRQQFSLKIIAFENVCNVCTICAAAKELNHPNLILSNHYHEAHSLTEIS